MKNAYSSIEEYNPRKKQKLLIADIISNETLHPIVTELFIRGRKLNTSLVFIAKSYFWAPKNVRLSTKHFFIKKIPNKQELHLIVPSSSSGVHITEILLQSHIHF